MLTAIEGVQFEAAWQDRVPSTYAGVPIHVLGLDHLLANKRAVGRPQDLLDVASLERRRQQRPGGPPPE